MSSNYLYSILVRLSFSRCLPQQLSKLSNPMIHLPNNVTMSPVRSARNLGVIFVSYIRFSQHISAVSRSCFYHMRDHRRIRNTFDHTIACTIATFLIHSKLNYCNLLLVNLPSAQTKRLQLVQLPLLVLSPKLVNFNTFHLFLNLFAYSKLMRESNAVFSHI
jgi:hypothetical protein